MIRVCVFVMLVFSVPAFSQPLNIGVRQGVNLAWQRFATSSGSSFTSDIQPGYAGGVYAIVKLSNKFAVQPEVLYSRMGGKGTASGLTFDNRLTYVQVPLLVRFLLIPRIYIYLGPQPGYLLSAKTFGSDVTDEYQRFECSITTGLGYEFPNGLNFNVRVLTGVTSTLTLKSGSSSRYDDGIQLSACFPIYRK